MTELKREKWLESTSNLKEEAQKMHEGREQGLTLCRKLIQNCAKSIRCIHRLNFSEAERLLEEAKKLSNEASSSLKDFPNLYYAGYLQDAQKELVEAAAMAAIAKDESYPTASELQIGLVTYLHGMGEAASEARRFALDRAREGNIREAERVLDEMELIYEELTAFDYPDGMTGGLRRTVDALRAVLERTRSDLSTTSSQQELIRKLDQIQNLK